MSDWDFETYTDQISAGARFPPLRTMDGLEAYFRWAGMPRYPLVLHVIESDEALKRTLREYWVDFNAVPVTVTPTRPKAAGPNQIRMRVRQTVLHDLMRRGGSWDEIYIGFQARYEVKPDLFHSKFFNHFGFGLPEEKCEFEAPSTALSPVLRRPRRRGGGPRRVIEGDGTKAEAGLCESGGACACCAFPTAAPPLVADKRKEGLLKGVEWTVVLVVVEPLMWIGVAVCLELLRRIVVDGSRPA